MLNPIQLIKVLNNPQQGLSELINSNPALKQNQPLMSAFNAFQNGNMQEVETIARNVCNQNGVKPEDMIAKAKNMTGQ